MVVVVNELFVVVDRIFVYVVVRCASRPEICVNFYPIMRLEEKVREREENFTSDNFFH